jgi:PTH1 family peptidyl-tRNA hydrolase
MKAIIGLGNVGVKYAATRHNLGFYAIDHLAQKHNFETQANSKLHAIAALGMIGSYQCLLAKPTTYMNLSGIAVQAISSYYKIKPQNIMIIHDDIDLALGRVIFKFAGGAGGHNGLKSINQLINNNYYRIRVGIDRPTDNMMDISHYVLSNFTSQELEIINRSIKAVINDLDSLLFQMIE